MEVGAYTPGLICILMKCRVGSSEVCPMWSWGGCWRGNFLGRRWCSLSFFIEGTHWILHNQETSSCTSSSQVRLDFPSGTSWIRGYVKIFLFLANKKKYIHTILKIHSIAIEINIKDCVKIGEMKKIWLHSHNERWRGPFFILSIFIMTR